MSDLAGVSVVVPVYRSQETLPELHARVAAVLEGLHREFEIILVEDCGPDDSWSSILKLAEEDRRVIGIQMSRNFGQHAALLCGIRAAKYPIIITIDDDLQHPPEEIPLLLAKLEEGYDVVYGTPKREQHGLFRDLASRITKLALQGAMGAETARNASAFRALRTPVREAFADFRGPFVVIDVLLTWGTKRFAAVQVKHDPRRVGESNYTFMKLVAHAINMATGFTAIPLQIASVLGFTLTLFGIGILVYVLLVYMARGHAVPGFTFLASTIAIFSGAQLFALGMIGEYMARMHFRLMDRPAYMVGVKTAEQVIPLIVVEGNDEDPVQQAVPHGS